MSAFWQLLILLLPKIADLLLGLSEGKADKRKRVEVEKAEKKLFNSQQKDQLREAFEAGDRREFRRVLRGELRDEKWAPRRVVRGD